MMIKRREIQLHNELVSDGARLDLPQDNDNVIEIELSRILTSVLKALIGTFDLWFSHKCLFTMFNLFGHEMDV